MRTTLRRTRLVVGLALATLLTACADNAFQTPIDEAVEQPQDYLEPVGFWAIEVDSLWNLVFWVAVGIFVFVQALIVVAILRFRERPGDEARLPRQIHGNPRLEALWTIIPALILAAVAVPTVRTLFDLAEEPADALVIDVIGHQWWWEYRYPQFEGLETANILYIPTGEDVVLHMTSEDVIHSFWVPKLAGKQDLIPGKTAFLKLRAPVPGEYLGQCAEFCGLSHANMRLRVVALEPAEFEEWARAHASPQTNEPEDELAQRGKALFATAGCVGCHTIRGYELSGDDPATLEALRALGLDQDQIDALFDGGPITAEGPVGPDLTYFATRDWFAGAIFETTHENVAEWLADPPAMKPMEPADGRGMPDLNMTEEEIAALVAYLDTLTTSPQ